MKIVSPGEVPRPRKLAPGALSIARRELSARRETLLHAQRLKVSYPLLASRIVPICQVTTSRATETEVGI